MRIAPNDIIVLGDKTSSEQRCVCVSRCVKRNSIIGKHGRGVQVIVV